MSLVKSIKRNSFFSFISSFARLLANFLIFIAIARRHGPEAYGQFTLAHTFATIFLLFADFGFDLLLTTEIAGAREKATTYFRQYFSLKLIFAFLAWLAMCVVAIAGNLSPETRILIFLFSFFMFFTALTNFISALYKGFERLHYETYVAIINNFGLLALVIVLLIFNASIIVISCGFVLSRLIGMAISIKYSFKILPTINYSLIFRGFKEVKNKVFVFGFHLLFVALYFQLDTILLGYLKGDEEVGIYQAVFKIILIPFVITDMLTNALTPVLTRLNKENIQLWERISYYMNKFLLFIILPITLVLFIYPDQIVNILYTKKNFSASVPIFQVFAFVLLVRFSFETFALALTTSNRQVIRMRVAITATFLNLILNYFIIPKYGALGAAYVSLVTNFFVSLVYAFNYSRLFAKWFLNKKLFLTYILFGLLGYLLWTNRELNIFLGSFIIILFSLLTGYFLYFSKEEREIIFSPNFAFSEARIK